jgi:hypothetical protein
MEDYCCEVSQKIMRRTRRKSLAGIVVGGMVFEVLFLVLWTTRANPTQRTAGEASVSVGNPIPSIHTPTYLLPRSEIPAPAFPSHGLKTVAKVMPVPVSIAVLDERRQFALGAIETANNDRAVGRAGEVSRYQIMPSVWKRYSGSSYYRDPQVSREVAQQHWSSLYSSFKKQTRREPNDFDMYVLWNTRYGYYASKGFNPARLHPVVRDSAQRFVNLVGRGKTQIASVPAAR